MNWITGAWWLYTVLFAAIIGYCCAEARWRPMCQNCGANVAGDSPQFVLAGECGVCYYRRTRRGL